MSDAERLIDELRRVDRDRDPQRWGSLKAQVGRAFPGWSFRSRLARLFSWSKR
jgi:hypothetical protein